MIVKLQDGLELGEGWKHISINRIIPVAGNDVNIAKENLYQMTRGKVWDRTGEPVAQMTETGAEVVFSLMVWDPMLWNRRTMSPQQGSLKDKPGVGSIRIGGTALARVALDSTRNTERNGICPRYGNHCLSPAAWSHRRWGSTSQTLNLTISCRFQRGWKVPGSQNSFRSLSLVTQIYLLSMLLSPWS